MYRVRTVLDGWPGSPGLNTFYFDPNGAPGVDTAQEAFTRVHDFWEAVSVNFPEVFFATTDQIVDDINPTTGVLLDSVAVTGVNVVQGNVSLGQFLPAQTQAFIQFKTAGFSNGRRIRGGTYIGPMAEPANGSDGRMETGALVSTAAAAIALIAPLASGGMACVWHRPTRDVGAAPGVNNADGYAYTILDTIVRPKWAALRSRRQ